MGSLSITAGTENPDSFFEEYLDYGTVLRDNYLDGVKTGTTNFGTWHRDVSQEFFEGYLLPDFHRRKNSGELLPYTYYLKSTSEIEVQGPGTVSAGYKRPAVSGGKTELYNWYWQDGSNLQFIGEIPLSKDKYSEARTLLIEQGVDLHHLVSQAAAKLYGRGWDGLTFFAEFRKLVTMFQKVVPNLIQILIDFRDWKQANSAVTLTNDVVNAWLEGRYGWRILSYDIEDINHLITSIDETQRTRNKEKVQFERTFTVSEQYVVGENHRRTYSDVTEYTLGFRGSIISDFLPGRITINPLLTAWELVPLSFVVDWVVNLGQAISTLSFLALNDHYTACTGFSLVAQRHVTCSISYHGAWAAGTLQHSNWDEIVVDESWEIRERTPVYVSALPYYNLNLSSFKVTDLIALLLQRVVS